MVSPPGASLDAPTARSVAEPHQAHRLHRQNGLERRLQSAPAAREGRGTDHANHVQERPRRERQGDTDYEKSGLTRGLAQGYLGFLILTARDGPQWAVTHSVAVVSPPGASLDAPTARSVAEPHQAHRLHRQNGLERRLQSAPAAREGRGTDHANHVQERPRCERQGDAEYEKSGLRRG